MIRIADSAPQPTSDSNSPETPAWRKQPSLVHALQNLASSIPDRIAYTFLPEGEDEEQNLTYAQLEARARTIGAYLSTLAKPGDRAGLVYESGLEYITALVGCYYAGIIAVPVYPPDPMRVEKTGGRLNAILGDAGVKLILTTVQENKRFSAVLTQGQVITTDTIATDASSDVNLDHIHNDTLCLLQYTSGSTGQPKGVMLTHSNLMFNYRQIRRFEEPNAVAVSWLPLYHDMGLIGLVMQALESGRQTVLMSPMSFVKRPVRWLRAVSKYRAYATSGPSFAYDLCVQKIKDEDCEGLDLSCLTLACNGAEPVRADIMERFTRRFEQYGFRWESFYPCYGLAENTLIVSGGVKENAPIVRTFDGAALDNNKVIATPEDAPQARELVGCGQSVKDQQVAIVDPETKATCSEGSVGEIWVKGPGVAQGYWQKPEISKETFQAHTSDTGDGPYLRTGDLGFIDDGEIFVTGRIKDMLIMRGRNYYPQDIERTVEESHKSMRRGQGAAFGVDVRGEERLVIVQGIPRPGKFDLDAVVKDIRSAVMADHGLAPYAVVLVKGGEIPRTSSGKIQRRECRQMYFDGKFRVVQQWCADDETNATTNDAQASPNTEPVSRAVNGSPQNTTRKTDDQRNAIFAEVAAMATELKEADEAITITESSMLLADLALESIDLVMLNEQIAARFQCELPITEFMAELGRTNRRDATMGEFVDFIIKSIDADTATASPGH